MAADAGAAEERRASTSPVKMDDMGEIMLSVTRGLRSFCCRQFFLDPPHVVSRIIRKLLRTFANHPRTLANHQ